MPWADPKTEAYEALIDMENDICARTLARVDEQAAALGFTRAELWPQLLDATRTRLDRYLKRLASPSPNTFLPMRKYSDLSKKE